MRTDMPDGIYIDRELKIIVFWNDGEEDCIGYFK